VTENHDSALDIGSMLDAWSDLLPDPLAMEQVTTLMLNGVRTAQPLYTSEPGEVQFRLLTYVWVGVAFIGYLVWDLLSAWLAANPIMTGLLILFGCLSLLAPLLLLPILAATNEGSSSPC
jgi:hypothetical protein